MKKAILFAAALFVAVASFAQNEYNYQKRSLFEQLPIRGNDIVFLGNSITDGCEWAWTKIYVQSILPVNGVDTKAKAKNHWKKGAEIIEANKLIEALCEGRKNVLYIDVYSARVDQKGMLDQRYTNDGLHLMGEGYLAWKEVIEKYVK